MTIHVNYLDNGVGIEIIASGTVTGQEIIEAQKEIYNPDHLNTQKYQIIDRTGCTKYQVYAEEIQIIADMDNEAADENPDIIIAVVASTTLQIGMTRMWQAYLRNDCFITKIFPDRKSADRWIKTYI